MKSDFNWLTVIDVLLHQAPWTWLQGLHDATHHCGSQPVEIEEPCSHKGIISNDNLDSFNVCPHLPVAFPFFPSHSSEMKENIWKLTQGLEPEPPCFEWSACYLHPPLYCPNRLQTLLQLRMFTIVSDIYGQMNMCKPELKDSLFFWNLY